MNNLSLCAAIVTGASLGGHARAHPHSTPRLVEPRFVEARVVEVRTQGGWLPVILRFHELEGGGWSPSLRNGGEVIPIDTPTPDPDGDALTLGFGHYDSKIELARNDAGEMVGTWTKVRGPDKVATLEARVVDRAFRFEPLDGAGAPEDMGGRWRVRFEDSDDDAVGVFEVAQGGRATGTFLTTTGDYRFLEGRVDGGLMRLSAFDGAHAFLFHARLQPDGTLSGDFWSGDWWHETWTAVRDEGAQLPDAFTLTTWDSDSGDLDELVFTDLNGESVSVAGAIDRLEDDGGTGFMIMVFGSWCPNCADATEHLVDLMEDRRSDGLRVLGLAFELTGDPVRDRAQVLAHQSHHGADWPVLIAGLSDKAKASESFPMLDKIRSYPTVIFMDGRHKVRGVWTGFSGPATGPAHRRLIEAWDERIDTILGRDARPDKAGGMTP